MSRERHPLYQQGVAAYLAHDTKAFETCLKQPELSQREYALLKTRKHMRAKRWSDAIVALDKVTDAEDAFLNAEKYFLRASCSFFQNNLEESAAFNQQAFHLYQNCADRRGQFLTSYNLSVDFGRIGLSKISRQHLKMAESLAAESSEKALVLRALACSASKAGKYNEACDILERLLNMFDSLTLHDRYVTKCVAADIYARAGKHATAREHLQSVHSNRLNIDTARTFFELKLLDFLNNENINFSPLPPALESSPEYALKWKFLAAFQGGECDQALKLWKDLRASQPIIFGEFPRAHSTEEQQDLFFQVIDKIGIKKPQKQDPIEKSALLEKLHETLLSSPMPLRKEELIEKIWGVAYSPEYDSRFYKLLERLKKAYKVRVVSERRAYRLV